MQLGARLTLGSGRPNILDFTKTYATQNGQRLTQAWFLGWPPPVSIGSIILKLWATLLLGRILPIVERRLLARNTSRLRKRHVNDLALVYFAP